MHCVILFTKPKQAMRWWQSAFSSSTSSSSTSSSSSLSSKVHSDDSLIASSTGGGIRYTLKSAFFFARRRRHARAKKLQNLAENDVDDWRSHYSENENLSSSKCSSSSDRRPPPQPLPLPELRLLLRHDADAAVSNEPSVPLPSPTDAHNSHHKTGEERNKDTHKDGVASHGRLSSQDARKKKKEHLGSRLSRKTPQKLHVADRVSDIRISAPISAPTTPYASPGLSPLKAEDFLSPNCMAFPGAFQVCSAPEMPPSDTPHYPGFSYKVIPEKNAFSVDNSPHHSPRASPQRSRKIANGSTSPLHHLLPHESSAARRESSAQGNVHPLPLPPLSATPSQLPSAIPPVSPNAELTPIKGQWQKGKLIGRGTFGSVYVASNRETGALCAMKEVELLPDDPKSAESIRQLQQEINVLSQLKHPNIVQYYGSEIVGDRFYIYLEYVHPGSINKFIHDHCGAITESIVRNFTRHILCGLAYLHSKKTIHRDIKGANLLVDAYGVVKLADFGMAKHLNGQAANLSLKGSPYWMAPELLQSVMQKDTNSDLAFATDIWSLGCTVIEMLNGKPPWSEYEAAAAMFKVLKDTPPIPETLSPEGKDFLRWCFCRNPAERPSASILLEHRFMRISHQPDVPSFLKPVGGVRIKEKLNSQKEQTKYNLDQGRLSLER